MMQQQQMAQQDQNLSNQQQMSPMVLCPVRVVYETQILMPPGEQIQPNHTFFVNPQNQPPWANQNTNIFPQNQMLYVQQMPNNIVSPVQQNMDQNQMFIQQAYQPMQQMMPNQNIMAPNVQDRQIMRPMFQNVPQNMNVINVNQFGQMVNLQNMANIAPNVPNLMQTQNINQNIQIMPNQTNSPKPPDLQPSVNFVRHINPNIRPNHHLNVQRPPQQTVFHIQHQSSNTPSPNPVQVQQNMPQNLPNSPTAQQVTRMPMPNNVRQTFVPNSLPMQQQSLQKPNQQTQPTNIQRPYTYTPPQNNIVVRPTMEPNITSFNTATQTTNTVRPLQNKMSTPRMPIQNVGPNTPNMTQQIRPRTILSAQPQPKPMQIRAMPQLRAVSMPNQTIMQNIAPTVSNVQKPIAPMPQNQIQNPRVPIPNTNQVFVNRTTININTDNTNSSSTIVNETRKRKSESPDEFKSKTSVNTATQVALPMKRAETDADKIKTNTCSEIGVNTSPVRRVKTFTHSTKSDNKSIKAETEEFKKAIIDIITSNTQQEAANNANNEKLTRNTVFSQSRVRKISNSSTDSKNSMEISIEPEPIARQPEPIVKQPEPVVRQTETVSEPKIEEKKPKKDLDKVKHKNNAKTKEAVEKTILKTEEQPKKEKLYTTEKNNESQEKVKKITDFGGKEIELSHGNINKRDGNESSYILTHVLDGIVIQESNVAFPIRIPLREKILPNIPVLHAEPKIESRVEEPKTTKTTKDEKILNISQLNLDSDSKETESPVEEAPSISEDNPFSAAKPQTIKAWTAEELADHLSKNGWHETASILQDHEIDGEALFLVSSTQLLDIGISEQHAVVLCDFVKS